MLDSKLLRTDIEEIAKALKVKGFELNQSSFVELEQQRKALQVSLQDLQNQRKTGSKQFGALKAKGESIDELKAQLDVISTKATETEKQLKEVGEALDSFLAGVPNLPDADVPLGSSEEDNQEVLLWGTPKAFEFEPLDHIDLGVGIDKGLDFDSAHQLTGSRFVVMKGKVARLHRALAQFMLDLHTNEHGYNEVNVPVIVQEQTMRGTGQLPKFEEDLFKLTREEHQVPWYLIPTAEVPLTNLVADSIIDSDQLPIKFVSHSYCFRSEAGSYGRDTRGMIRQHQFEKVELVQIVKPEQSDSALEELTGQAEKVLQLLELPYRKVLLCGGDMGFSAAKTYDLEVWVPSQKKYREISSCSNCTDFQARRMRARYKGEGKKNELVHTLNGSGLAVGRCLIAVMENYQNEDGSIQIPTVLQSYMGGLETIR